MISFWQIPMRQWATYEQIALERLHLAFHGLTHTMMKEFSKKAGELITNKSDLDAFSVHTLSERINKELWGPMISDWTIAFGAARREAADISLSHVSRYHIHYMTDYQEQLGQTGGEPYAGALPYAGTMEQVLAATARRVWGDGFSLSSRIWKVDAKSRQSIRKALFQGVAQNKPTVDIAKDLEKFLGFGADCPRWTMARLALTPQQIASGDKTGLLSGADCSSSGIAYNALRLARTELQVAHGQAASALRQESPFAEGEQLYLHDLHPPGLGCACEDEVGYPGSTVGPVQPVGHYDGVLPYHPNCMCYVKTVLQEVQSVWQRIKRWIKGKLHWDEFTRYLGQFNLPIRQIPSTPGGDLQQQAWWAILIGLAATFQRWISTKERDEIPSLFGIEDSEWLGEFYL